MIRNALAGGRIPSLALRACMEAEIPSLTLRACMEAEIPSLTLRACVEAEIPSLALRACVGIGGCDRSIQAPGVSRGMLA
jgi:hypothetical protein